MTTTWAIALLFAACAAASPDASKPAQWAGAAVYFAGSLVCHQLPGRSFHYLGVQLPVCARCTGLYAGAVLAAWAGFASSRSRGAHARGLACARLTLIGATIPAALTLAYEWSTGVMPSNVIRAATGVLLGAAVMWLLTVFGLRSSVEYTSQACRPNGSRNRLQAD